MLPKIAADPRAKERFLREVENTKALQHANVVRLQDSGCSQGIFFFTLEFCDGGSVDQLMKKCGGTLSIGQAKAIALQALDGLEYAHNVFGPGDGLVHRDIKPHNIFLSGSESASIAKVGDYGLAKAFDLAGLSGQTRTGAMAGTPEFMPRQLLINFKYAKPEVDVWAMAASLYSMLTGHAPRDFPRRQDWWRIVLETPAVPIRKREASIPRRLAEVIDTALVDQPNIPFKTAIELKQALEQTD
jgi:serine/threonine-protein kinase